MYPNPTHVQVRMSDGVVVDATLAPLLWDLRQRGVDTRASCERDDRDRAYIMVLGPASVETAMRRCLELAAEIGDRALVQRVHGRAQYLPPSVGRPEQMVGPDGWSIAGDLRPAGLVDASPEPVMIFRIDLPAEDVVVLAQHLEEPSGTAS